MKKLIISILLLIPLSTFAQLTGYWQSDVGGCYQVRQNGNEVWWAAEPSGSIRAMNVLHGTLTNNILAGMWCDLPSNSNTGCGQTITIRVENSNRMVKISSTAPYYGSIWTRSNGPCTSTNSNTSSSNVLSASTGNNQILPRNGCIYSPSRTCFLHMKENGYLALYRGSGPNDSRKERIWIAPTGAKGNCFMALQSDGNLVVYNSNPPKFENPVWNSGSYGHGEGNYCLAVEDNGRIVIYKGSSPGSNSSIIWKKPD